MRKEFAMMMVVLTMLVGANRLLADPMSGATLLYESRFNSVPYRSYKVYKREDGSCALTIGKNVRHRIKEVNCPKGVL